MIQKEKQQWENYSTEVDKASGSWSLFFRIKPICARAHKRLWSTFAASGALESFVHFGIWKHVMLLRWEEEDEVEDENRKR